MPIAATLLFGSLARADQSEGSDTDLLMIGLDEETRHVSIGNLSLFLYPWRQLEQDARDGDLFVCHLVREAKPLIDPDNYLPKTPASLSIPVQLCGRDLASQRLRVVPGQLWCRTEPAAPDEAGPLVRAHDLDREKR